MQACRHEFAITTTSSRWIGGHYVSILVILLLRLLTMCRVPRIIHRPHALTASVTHKARTGPGVLTTVLANHLPSEMPTALHVGLGTLDPRSIVMSADKLPRRKQALLRPIE